MMGRSLVIGSVALAGLLFGSTSVAQADHYHHCSPGGYGYGGYGYGGYRGGYGVGVGIGYAPPYYAAPPVVYAPRPVAYGPHRPWNWRHGHGGWRGHDHHGHN